MLIVAGLLWQQIERKGIYMYDLLFKEGAVLEGYFWAVPVVSMTNFN